MKHVDEYRDPDAARLGDRRAAVEVGPEQVVAPAAADELVLARVLAVVLVGAHPHRAAAGVEGQVRVDLPVPAREGVDVVAARAEAGERLLVVLVGVVEARPDRVRGGELVGELALDVDGLAVVAPEVVLPVDPVVPGAQVQVEAAGEGARELEVEVVAVVLVAVGVEGGG